MQHKPRVPIDNRHQIKPICFHWYIGNVDGPNMIRMVDFKPFQKVGIYFIGRFRPACILPCLYGLYAHFLHMPKDCFVIVQIMLFFIKIPANTAISIHWVSGIDFVNQLLNVQIFCGMWSRLIIEPASIISPRRLACTEMGRVDPFISTSSRRSGTLSSETRFFFNHSF